MNKLPVYIIIFLFILINLSNTLAAGDIEVLGINYPDEIFPVYCTLGSKIFDNSGIFDWKIRNNSKNEQTIKITTQVIDFSNPAIQTVTLKSGEVKELSQFPVFNDKVLENTEQKLSSVSFKIQRGNDVVYEETKAITMLATDDMIWGIDTGFDTSFLLGAWVTPRDPMIGKIVSIAKEKMPDRTLCGYQRESQDELFQELEAVWTTLQELGISYVSSSISFASLGNTQKVRLPRESIIEKSANCVDGTVLMASVLEYIEMEPVIVLTNDHAFLGVKTSSGGEEIQFIETTLLGSGTLQEAMDSGNSSFEDLGSLKEGNDYIVLDIIQLRQDGITPMPVKGNVPEI